MQRSQAVRRRLWPRRGVRHTFDDPNWFSTNLGVVAKDADWYSYLADPSWYGSPAGLFFTSTRPQAVRFVGAHDRTYIAYGGLGNPSKMMLTAFDHDTGAMLTAVAVADNLASDDAHGNPAIAIDSAGYIYFFYGTDASSLRMRKSTAPETLAFGAAVIVSAAGEAYPSPLIVGTTLYVFFRHKVSDSPYIKSYGYKSAALADITTWSAYTPVIQFAAPSNIYAVTELGPESPTPAIHIAWMKFNYVSDTDNAYLDAFYAVSPDAGATWKKSDGTVLTLPIADAAADKVYSTTGGVENWPVDLRIDAAGAPHILNIAGVRTDDLDNRGTFSFLHHARRAGAWSADVVAAGADHLFDRGALKIDSASVMRAWLTLGGFPTQDGGEIQEYATADGGVTWAKAADRTIGSRFSANYPKTVLNADPDLEVVFGYGDSEPSLLLGYGAGGGFVTPSDWTFGHAGLEVYARLGGAAVRANGRIEITMGVASHQQYVVHSAPEPATNRYQRIRFNPAVMGNSYRFSPLLWTWQRADLQDGTRLALRLLWYSAGLHLYASPANGDAGVVITQLTAATPTAGEWYVVEMWQQGASTHVKVVKESDLSVVYDGETVTNDYAGQALYAAFGQYLGTSSPGAITGYYDDWEIRRKP